jgi:hypothetical protein
MTLMDLPLAAWTTLGGGNLQYGIVLGLVLGPIEASAAGLLATLATLI